MDTKKAGLIDFIDGYIEALLWSEVLANREGSYSINFDDIVVGNISHEDVQSLKTDYPMIKEECACGLSTEFINEATKDCIGFFFDNIANIKLAALNDSYENTAGVGYSQAGHDFALTRNGHGTGYWDRGHGDVGDELTEACGWKTDYPEVNLYLGDDGLIYSNAKVFGDAKVHGDVVISGNARVSGDTRVYGEACGWGTDYQEVSLCLGDDGLIYS